MKCKFLLHSRRILICGLYGLILQAFLVTGLWAGNGYRPELDNGEGGDAHLALNASKEVADIVITGTVTDEAGVGIPGVSVLIKGTTTGTITETNGNYKIAVRDESDVLVFSYVGYVQEEIVVGKTTVIDVVMIPDITSLEEVVVVGYGTQKKSEITNAVVQAEGEEIKRTPSVSLSNSLAGRLAGLYVNQTSSVPGFDDASVLVRGYNTFRDNSALIVIDGVASGDPDGLNRLDPNDIESISVLKDASAAIYGAQSAGGVVLVTTKRGKSGRPRLTYNGFYGLLSPTQRVKTANALEYMGVLNSSRAIDGTDPDFPDELIEDYKDGTFKSEDWWGALIDAPAQQSRHSLTMTGGTEKIKYFTSAGTVNQGGILVGDDKTSLRQYNVRSNLDINVIDNFDVGVDLSWRQKDTQTPQGGAGAEVGYVATFSPLRPAFIDDDTRYPAEGWSHTNPAARVKGPGYRKYLNNVLNSTFRFKYTIPHVEGLFIDGFASVILTDHYEKEFNWIWDYYEKNSDGEIVRKDSRTIEDPGLKEYYDKSRRITLNTKINYSTSINDKHNISAFVAYEQMDYDFNYFWVQRLGYESAAIDQLFAGSTDRSNWNSDGSASESARRNYFGRATYDFKYKYLLGFNFRYDGSPIFPDETRWGFFPGVSAGWVISDEAFMPEFFSNLKLRASWGQVGNDRVDPFQYIGAYEYASGWVVDGSDVRGLEASTTPNPNITWEVSETTDIGLEAGFLDGRLNFEFDVFKTITSDILAQRQASIPNYTGLVLPDENIGEMENKGFEIQAEYRQDFGHLNFKTQANLSYTENKILYFDEVPQAEPYQKLEGTPYGSDLVYKTIGIYRTQDDIDNNVNYNNPTLGGLIFEDLNGDGFIDANDRYRFDNNSFPRMQFGWNIAANYKGFDFSILFQGQGAAQFRLDNGFDAAANGNGLAYVANNSYSLDNPGAELPRIRPTGTAASDNDFWYHNLFFIRAKSLELGYTLPQRLLSPVGIEGLRLYFSGENLFMIYNSVSKYGAGDPQQANGKGATYPLMRALNFGVNLTF